MSYWKLLQTFSWIKRVNFEVKQSEYIENYLQKKVLQESLRNYYRDFGQSLKEHIKLSVYIGTTVIFTGFVPFNNITLNFLEINQ